MIQKLLLTALVGLAIAAPLDFATKARAADSPQPSTYEKVLLEKNIQPDADGLNKYLRALHPGEQQRKRATQLIQELGSVDSYAKREAAMKELLVMPTLPTEMLVKATEGGDPEVRWRARQVLKIGKPESTRALYAAFRVIEKKKLSATVAAALDAVPLCDKRYMLTTAQRALEAAAAPENAAVLRTGIESENGDLRAVATAALGRALGKKAARDFQQLLKDSSGPVKLAAARAMADYGDRQSLRSLVDLLDFDNVDVRAGSIVTLREFTGKRFAYAAYDKADRRAAAAKKWNEWIDGDGKTAKLSFPLKRRITGGGYLAGNTLLAYGYKNKVVEFDASGKEVWSYANLQGAWSAEKLANGNVLIAQREGVKQVIEVNPNGKVVWRYAARGGCTDAHRLENGNTLIASYGVSIFEVTPAGKVVWEYPETQSRGCQPLPSGNVLIVSYNSGRVIEVTREKKIVWECQHANPTDVFRLPNGNTLISGSSQFVEITPDKKIVWSKAGCRHGSARR
ncbi:MAG: HEAT repeat domain-containing protein [Planctomycetes bacterium]|nr:HEAT repeat domain-containing protein [Planctomycetota bacterium]